MCGGAFILLYFRYETNILAFSKMIAEKMASLSFRDGVENIMFLLLIMKAFNSTLFLHTANNQGGK